jgi:hypothetical protein
MRRSGGGSAVLGYRDYYVVDGGKARNIPSALVTPASIMDNTSMLDLVEYVCSRWQLHPEQATSDTKYGTVPNIVGLEEMGIKAYIPIRSGQGIVSRQRIDPAQNLLPFSLELEFRLRFLQELGNLEEGFLPGIAVALLQEPGQLIAAAFDALDVIVVESFPPLL